MAKLSKRAIATFHHAVKLSNAIGDAGGFDYYDAHELDPPPVSHFVALINQGFTDAEITRGFVVPTIA